jgi:hypothetical protein
MRRFPLRLRAALAKTRILPHYTSSTNSPILRLDADELLHRAADHPVSHESVREILRDRRSIVWMGGAEPLAHPGIGHLTQLIVQARHYLFLDTDGVALRGRIHEFQPFPRFYFSIRFHGCEAEHDRRSGRSGAFRGAIEGIRAMQLSGFFVCANVVVQAGSDPKELVRLFDELRGLDLDGAVISSASPQGEVGGAVVDGRRQFLSAGWAAFSRHVDAAGPLGVSQQSECAVDAPSRCSAKSDFEESVQAR